MYTLHNFTPAPKKRKRDRWREDTAIVVISPVEDPGSATELLIDRLSVWQAVAELGIGIDEDKGKGKCKEDEDGMQAILRRFWEDVMKAL